MHGRVKVRTSAEDRERKKKEQALKVKAYKAAMTKLQSKREVGEYDDEMLQLTTQILVRNPDVLTLWNLRRECMEQKSKEFFGNKKRLQELYDKELGVTEQCLMANPKSYGGWHHRCWTLEHSPQANWEHEMQLCNKYLKLDERNFHTWSYRRYVVSKANIEKQPELDFCTEKIKANFSNYSSWHYRSLLLPAVHPYEGDAVPKRAMSEHKLKEELEMVLTAAFTDPNDSSAWFYQRWLLGYSRPELDICAFRCDNEKAVLAFTKPVAKGCFKIILQDEDSLNVLELHEWYSSNQNTVDTTWIAKMPNNHPITCDKSKGYKIEIHIPNETLQNRPLKSCLNGYYFFVPPNRTTAFSADILADLEFQLESCNSLLEFEPDSKWTLLTTALLMHAIDRQQFHYKSLEFLEKLQKVDFLREGYYKDLASKWTLEKLLLEWSDSAKIPMRLNLEEQSQLSSTAIHYAQYLSIFDEVVLPAELRECGVKLKTFGTLNM